MVATGQDRVMLYAYMFTGARRREIFRWTWNEDINFEARMVRLGSRKNRSGQMEYEWLPMSDELYNALWSHWQNRQFKESPFVFNNPDERSEHYGKRFVSRNWWVIGLCKRAGVRRFNYHSIRRYVATRFWPTSTKYLPNRFRES